MTGNKILYVLLIIISAAFYMFYIDNLSMIILLFVLALPFFLGLMLIAFKFTAKLSIEANNPISIKKGKTVFSVCILNRIFLPFTNCILTIEYGNNLNKSVEQITVSIPVHAFSREKINIALSSDYCGIIEARAKSLRVYDYLKLFSCKVKSKSSAQVYIMPETHEIRNEYCSQSMETDDSELYSKNKSGDDPAEIFDLKEYAYGDKINRIHWNLSLRQDNIIVRHYSQPIVSSVLLAVEYIKPNSISGLQIIDSVMETAASVSEYLFENETSHNIAFYNRYTMSFEVYTVSDQEELMNVIIKMYRAGAYSGEVKIPEFLKENSNEYSKIIYVTSKYDHNSSDVNEGQREKKLSVIYISEYTDECKNMTKNSSYLSVVIPGNVPECISRIII